MTISDPGIGVRVAVASGGSVDSGVREGIGDDCGVNVGAGVLVAPGGEVCCGVDVGPGVQDGMDVFVGCGVAVGGGGVHVGIGVLPTVRLNDPENAP